MTLTVLIFLNRPKTKVLCRQIKQKNFGAKPNLSRPGGGGKPSICTKIGLSAHFFMHVRIVLFSSYVQAHK